MPSRARETQMTGPAGVTLKVVLRTAKAPSPIRENANDWTGTPPPI